MSLSEARKRANNKWAAANMTVLGCKIRKDKADLFKAECKAAGTSPNAVFTAAIDSFLMERDVAQAPASTTAHPYPERDIEGGPGWR